MSDTTEPARDDEDEEELLPPGNPPRWRRGTAFLLLGSILTVLLMSFERPLRWGVLLGLGTSLVAAFGALDLLGTFDDEQDPAHTVTLGSLLLPLARLGLALAATLAVLTLGARGALAPWLTGLLLTAGAIASTAAVHGVGFALGPYRLDERGAPRPLVRRHGFWVVTLAAALYLPAAGAHSLTDPWETHYGEVAREMLARHDWISTWWAQEGWFFSKPVWNFWIQALSLSLLGSATGPDQVLALTPQGAIPRPEWAVRAPVVVMAIVALYLLYKGVARVFGRRAGLLGAVVLMTMPQWSFLAHQTMTDMPFVSALTGAMGLLLLGIHTDPEREGAVYEVQLGARGRLRLGAFHLVFTAVLLCALPQLFYLISRNLDLTLGGSPAGFRWHGDVFWSGSAGNCGLPGNEPCLQQRPFNALVQPALQALLWATALGSLLYLNAGERRLQRLSFIAAFLCASVATLAKGPAGLALPVLCALIYVAVTGRWRELTRLELLSGTLLLLAVALPWYVAMYLRHGPAFIDRLIFHDMWKRALTHVHDTNEGDDVSFRFYLWQLGYAVFPWTGLVPAALVAWARRPDDADEGRGDASIFLAMWFLLSFALFSWMLTKFHHYIFPAVPPAAMLTGVLLDRLLRARLALPAPRLLALLATGPLLAWSASCLWPGAFLGDTSAAPPASPLSALLGLMLTAVIGLWGALGHLEPSSPDDDERPADGLDPTMLSAVLLAGIALLALVGRDLASRPSGEAVGEARLLYLFTYNYRRAWPDSLDFSSVLAGFTAAAVLLSALLASRRLRTGATLGLVGLALSFGAFCLDLYFVKAAPHWGQRDTIEAYYRLRAGPQEPLVAYQMNWKGENFYTGNHIPAFVASGERFKDWVKAQRAQGVSTLFFTTEHSASRLNNLRTELGNPPQFEVLTDRHLNNKFALVRVRY